MAKLSEDLLAQARDLGLSFSPNIGEATLKERIRVFELAQETISENVGVESAHERAARLKKVAMRKSRVRVTCLNHMKQTHQGFWAITSNNVIGTIKEFIPVNVEWHITEASRQWIKAKRFTPADGSKGEDRKAIPEYAIEELDPLTITELEDLRKLQASKHAKH